MNSRTCPDCTGVSYFSGSGADWDCPYCGKNLGDVLNEQQLWSYSTAQSKPESKPVPIVKNASRHS